MLRLREVSVSVHTVTGSAESSVLSEGERHIRMLSPCVLVR